MQIGQVFISVCSVPGPGWAQSLSSVAKQNPLLESKLHGGRGFVYHFPPSS